MRIAFGPFAFPNEGNPMAARKVGRGKRKGFKRPRKPPLHILSDFGSIDNTPMAKVAGLDKRLKSKGDYGAK